MSARNGWILLIFGGAISGLMLAGTPPAADTQPAWFTLFVVITGLGGAILMVHLGSWALSVSVGQKRASRLQLKREAAAFQEEGL